MNIALVGYFGHGNLGDEAILQSIISQLKKFYKPLKITVFTASPEKTKNKYKVEAFYRKSIPSLLAGISMSDIVVFAGGSLFQDITSFRSLLYYCSIIFLARMYGKKVILYSQGIEPLKYYHSQVLLRNAFTFANHISVRDSESLSYLKNTIKLKKKVCFAVDSGLMLNPLIKDNKYKEFVGINFIEVKNFPIENVVMHLGKFNEKYGVKYLYIPFNKEDVRIGKELEKRLGSSVLCYISENENVSEVLGIISQLKFVVGARLHSLILSASAYVPFIGIHYHDKIESFSKDVKQKYISFNNLQNGCFYSNLVDVYENRLSYHNQLKYLVDELKGKSKDNLINNILIKYDKTR